jgi:hypothetical protein
LELLVDWDYAILAAFQRSVIAQLRSDPGCEKKIDIKTIRQAMEQAYANGVYPDCADGVRFLRQIVR